MEARKYIGSSLNPVTDDSSLNKSGNSGGGGAHGVFKGVLLGCADQLEGVAS